jgi:UDP-2,3-diacylglucosamine hydrolase
MAALFISDLHLDPDRPDPTRQFIEFTRGPARDAEHLYVLGDLFEAWIGDDDDDPGIRPIVDALADLTQSGVACAFMHGNRDFLIGAGFAARTGCRLLPEYATIDVYGERLLLTHGDLLCTDDTRYMTLRATVRDPEWRRDFLAKPLPERRHIARELRTLSRNEIAAKSEQIMDVNTDTVAQTMREFGVQRLLHGHTHRPGIHEFELDGRPATRIVLGAWYEHGSVVRWDASGFALEALPPALEERPPAANN